MLLFHNGANRIFKINFILYDSGLVVENILKTHVFPVKYGGKPHSRWHNV